MRKWKFAWFFLALAATFLISDNVHSQAAVFENLKVDLKSAEINQNLPDCTRVELNIPRMPVIRELSWFEYHVMGTFYDVLDYFFGTKPDGAANDGAVLLIGLSMLPIGEAFQIERAGVTAVEVASEMGITRSSIVAAFKSAGVPPKYIQAFKSAFQGFVKMEEWDRVNNPVWAMAVTNAETGSIYARYENLWWESGGMKNFYNTLLEEAVHADQVRTGAFVPEHLLEVEARAKVIAYKYFGNWPADKEVIRNELRMYRAAFSKVLSRMKK